ncbi:MAG: hypothetical protein JXB32_15735 [Deltaproteobacteria bacterium]|nr:hypothetical protein [Deltaproteobacteria bacterium]
MSNRRTIIVVALFAVLLAAGCKKSKSAPDATLPPVGAGDAATPPAADAVPPPPVADAAPAPEIPDRSKLDRDTFNRLAVHLGLPLFWRGDENGDGILDPAETSLLMFRGPTGGWLEDGKFTAQFDEAYARLAALAAEPEAAFANLEPAEAERRKLVREELDQGYPTLVHNDLSALPEAERLFLDRMLFAGEAIDRLYALQSGAAALEAQLPADDPASRFLFLRNWGTRCVAPSTERNEKCCAIPGCPKQPVDAYPAALQDAPDFCKQLAERPNGEELLGHFNVVRDDDAGGLRAVPYHEAYANEMKGVALELRRATEHLAGIPEEAALVKYLGAAATAFETNDWEAADEAWAAMNAENSKWYVRVAPDETYWEPCNTKAGFHLTLARINTGSLAWQERLQPVQQAMEDELAELIGAPYEARSVTFHLPDFIDIVANHGDDRDPMGAVIGQSLPNWGPVANEGRGRTWASTNLYGDPDSRRMFRRRAESLLDTAAMAWYSDDREPGLLSTMLHEATHNLGPSHEYKVDGKVDDDVFGGPLATVLEELKAQTGALWLTLFLQRRGVIDEAMAKRTWTDSLLWATGHISRGMYTAAGEPKPYSQLAAIHFGFFLDRGALRFDPEGTAANGTDQGVFSIDFEKLPAAIEELMTLVGRIKARGDKAAGEELVRKYVDGDVVPLALITERVLRDPKTSFFYALDYGAGSLPRPRCPEDQPAEPPPAAP